MPARKPRNKAFELGGIMIEPGQQHYIELPLPALYTHANVFMPVHVSVGKEAGPVMFISAAVHGEEINGVEIIRRVINTKAMRRLRGTLVSVPVVNVYGFISKSRYLPDRRDLNRYFPGNPQGSAAARIAHSFFSKIVLYCDGLVDVHTGSLSRANLPQIRADLRSGRIGLEGDLGVKERLAGKPQVLLQAAAAQLGPAEIHTLLIQLVPPELEGSQVMVALGVAADVAVCDAPPALGCPLLVQFLDAVRGRGSGDDTVSGSVSLQQGVV